MPTLQYHRHTRWLKRIEHWFKPADYGAGLLFLRASSILGIAEAGELTTWVDDSIQGNDATGSTGKPVYHTSGQNGQRSAASRRWSASLSRPRQ